MTNLKEPAEPESAVSTSAPEVAKRIAELVGVFESRVQAAKVAGISTEQLKRYEAGAAPRLVPVGKLCTAAGWSLDYIWTGRRRPAERVDEQPAHYSGEFFYVPRYDVEVSAGGGAVIDEERVLGRYAFRQDWARSKGWDPAHLALIQVRGDSMTGIIDDGQLVLVDMRQTKIRGEGIYVILLDERLVAKIVQPDFNGDLYIRSTNPAYREITVPHDQVDSIRVIGRAVWTDRPL